MVAKMLFILFLLYMCGQHKGVSTHLPACRSEETQLYTVYQRDNRCRIQHLIYKNTQTQCGRK